MTTPAIFAGMMGAGSQVDIGDTLANSLMLDSGASQYLSRTPGVAASNLNVACFSMRVKRGKLGSVQTLFSAQGVSYTLFFDTNDTLAFYALGQYTRVSSQLFRDPSAWLNFVFAFDSTQAEANDRIKVWLNGTLMAWTTNVAWAQNVAFGWGGAVLQEIGARSGAYPADLYLANCIGTYGITGLTSNDFGYVSPDTGQWVPKNYTGTYGTNGFKLDFTNGSALGTDSSGNGNNWTLNGGITSANQYTDTPTNNFCVLNPLAANGGGVFSRGNTRYTVATTANQMASSTIIVSAGKWYVEASFDTAGAGNFAYLGLVPTSASFASGQYPGSAVGSYGAQCNSASVGSYTGGVVTNATPGAYNNSTPLKMAVDFDAGKVWFGISTWLGGGNPAAGTLPTYTFTPGTALAVCIGAYQQSSVLNVGQRPFAYTPPIGFKALCTANLISEVITVSGTFTGNAAADGPFVFCNGYPTTLTINSNAVTFGTHADKTANGFKLRTSSAGYNAAGSNSWAATIVSNRKNALKYANAQGNP